MGRPDQVNGARLNTFRRVVSGELLKDDACAQSLIARAKRPSRKSVAGRTWWLAPHTESPIASGVAATPETTASGKLVN